MWISAARFNPQVSTSLPKGMWAKTLLLALVVLLSSPHLRAQVAAAPVLNGPRLVGGGFVSAFSPNYQGNAELYGVGGYVDLDVRHHLGAEAEARFLRFNQTYDVHEETYAAGLRYRWQFRRYEVYGKFLIGNGQFNFPFGYGHGGYLMLVPGGGLDVHWHRFTIRAIDYEAQRWMHFQSGTLTPDGFSTGIGYRIF
jgi:hypothetical protein